MPDRPWTDDDDRVEGVPEEPPADMPVERDGADVGDDADEVDEPEGEEP